jgi:hypothetical protein
MPKGGKEFYMKDPKGFDVVSSLTRWFNDHQVGATLKEVDAFVDANRGTIQLVADAWYPMLRQNDVIWRLLSCVPEATSDFFKAFNCCKQWDGEILTWIRRQGPVDDSIQLPPPFDTCDFKEIHEVFNYPKRAPLVDAPWLEAEARDKFLSCMMHTKTSGTSMDELRGEAGRTYNVFRPYLPIIRKWLDEVLPSVEDLQKAVRNLDQYDFSAGAVMDACTNPFCKWFRARYYTWRADRMLEVNTYPDPVARRNPIEEFFRSAEDTSRLSGWSQPSWKDMAVYERKAKASVPRYVVKAMTVPKQLTSLRTVCPEDSWHARVQGALSKCVRRKWENLGLDKLFCYKYQERSRAAAALGAKAGQFATIDSTAASDTVFRDWIREIDHPSLNYLLEYMPTHVKWGSTMYPMEMFGTMGSPLTFDVEMIIFYIDCRLSELLCHFGDTEDTAKLPAWHYIDVIFIVGDDLSVPNCWAETLLDVMVALHRIPNREKTYHSGPYRESCGAEYLGNLDVSGIYYPRGLVITDDINSVRWDGYKEEYVSPIISLIDHHNDLVDHGWYESAERILTFISGEVDVSVGLDVTGMFQNTLRGLSATLVEEPDGSRHASTFFNVPKNGHILLYSPKVTWVDAEPSRKCWCGEVSSSVFDALKKEWERNIVSLKGRYVIEGGGSRSLRIDYASSVHKQARVTLELQPHA